MSDKNKKNNSRRKTIRFLKGVVIVDIIAIIAIIFVFVKFIKPDSKDNKTDSDSEYSVQNDDITSENEMKIGKLKRLTWKGADFPVYSQVLIHKDKKQNKAIKALAEIIMSDTENYGE